MSETEETAKQLFKMGLCQHALTHHGIAADFAARDCEQCFVAAVAAALREAQMNDSALHMERLRTNSLCKQRDELQSEIAKLKAERDAAYVRGLEVALSKLETGGFQGPTLNYILMFRRHIQAEIQKAEVST